MPPPRVIVICYVYALSQVDAMVDLRDIVDGFEFEAFPWSERCGHALNF